MAKAPSAETQLRTLKRELATLRDLHDRTSKCADVYLRRATKAEQEVIEWKQRFDLLLSKCRDASITEGEVR